MAQLLEFVPRSKCFKLLHGVAIPETNFTVKESLPSLPSPDVLLPPSSPNRLCQSRGRDCLALALVPGVQSAHTTKTFALLVTRSVLGRLPHSWLPARPQFRQRIQLKFQVGEKCIPGSKAYN